MLFAKLDTNRDGLISFKEFGEGMSDLAIPGLAMRDYEEVFNAIDMDNNMTLTLNEFCAYLEGAQKTRAQRIDDIPPEISDKIDQALEVLFEDFDRDSSGTIDAKEIIIAMRGLGLELDIKDA